MGKKILSVMIAACLLLTTIPVFAVARENPVIMEEGEGLSGNEEVGMPDGQTLEGMDGEQVFEGGDTDGGDGLSVDPPMPEINEEAEENLNACEMVEADGDSVELRAGQMASLPLVSSSGRGGTTVAITSDGDLYCWGYNFYGQVGNGTRRDQSEPVKVLEKVASVFCYGHTMAAVQENGDLYCWGENEYGQVGDGTKRNQSEPVWVLDEVASVSCYGHGTMAAVQKNGDLYCWGYNGNGQVGNGTMENQSTPVRVLDRVAYVCDSGSGFVTMAAVQENGDLYCWGYNEYGQVGNGTMESQSRPVKVLEKAASVYSYGHSEGFRTMAAIQENGDLYCWGYNGSGQVGNGTMENQSEPVWVLEKVTSVSGYGFYSPSLTMAAVQENGDLYCWGENFYGQVGDGQVGDGRREDQSRPVKVLEKVTSICGFNYYDNCVTMGAIQENGDLYCWGYNGSGQVGNGTMESQSRPVKVLEKVTSVSFYDYGFDYNHDDCVTTAAIQENGDLYCWGYNRYSQVGNETMESWSKPVQVLGKVDSVYSDGDVGCYDGRYDWIGMAAIQENGDLYCWGYNRNGQVGDGMMESWNGPVKMLEKVVSASVFNHYSGLYHYGTMAAIQENGDLYCWGYNGDGQVGDGTTEYRNRPVMIMDLIPGNPSPGDDIDSVQISLSDKTANGPVNKEIYLTGNVSLKDGTKLPDGQWEDVINSITWMSSDEAVAKISKCSPVPVDIGEYGERGFQVSLVPQSVGTAIITGILPNGQTAVCEVTVMSISLDKDTLALTVGESGGLSASIFPTSGYDQSLLWSSSDPAVATVTDTGMVEAVSAGTAEITAETADGKFKASCTVTVSEKSTSTGGGGSSQTPGTGGSGGSTGTGTPAATVTPTPVPSETPTVTVTPTPGSGETPSVTPTPTGTPKPTVTVMPTPQPKAAQSLGLRYDSKDKKLKWGIGSRRTQKVSGAETGITFSSSNPKVAKVNKNNGVITCVGVGKVVITAKAAGSSQYKAASKKTTIYVIPKTAGIRFIRSNRNGQVTIKSNKRANGNDGYQIQYKHNGKTKKVKVKGTKTIAKTLKNLRSGKDFKVRMRAYKKVDGITYYGKYSKWKTLKKVK